METLSMSEVSWPPKLAGHVYYSLEKRMKKKKRFGDFMFSYGV